MGLPSKRFSRGGVVGRHRLRQVNIVAYMPGLNEMTRPMDREVSVHGSFLIHKTCKFANTNRERKMSVKFYCQDADRVLEELHSRPGGLTSAEAAERLARDGKNKLAEAKKASLLRRFLAQLADPMILILLAAAAVSGVLAAIQGESFADVVIILAVVLVNAVLGVVQENKAEKAIEALQEMSAATSKVLRDGQVCTVRSEDLAVGDVVLLEAGDAVPADGRLIESASLKTGEAALTGESVPVTKFLWATGGTWSTWAPPWPTAAAWPSSRPRAWTRRWAGSPMLWPGLRRGRRPCSGS